MVITIDGPAGSGKSTTARRLSQRLNIAYLDTGAMYRAVAYATLQADVDPSDECAVVEIAQTIELSVNCGPDDTKVTIDGHDVSDAVRTLEVSRMTSRVARIQPVRDILVARQRELGAKLGSFVSEGRDQGSVVFPDAEAKFILDASDHRRAQRRLDDIAPGSENVTFEEMLEHVRQRDAIDSKQWKSLLEPGAAVRVDTTDLDIEGVVDKLEAYVRKSTTGDAQRPVRD